MHDPAPQTSSERALTTPRAPEYPVLPETTPALDELFAFMAEAELRFESLRMRIVDRQVTTHGEEVVTHDVWFRHPGFAKVVSTRGASSEGDYEVWLSDGDIVRTFNALGHTATERRARRAPVGVTDPDLPRFARVYLPQTALEAETVADTFVHPNGLCRNVLTTGLVSRRGTASLAGGRETILLRCDHPRASHVLLDRPDHWLEVGVDAQTGMLLLYAEHVGDRMTRHAEASSVRLDETIPDSAFTIHVSSDTRTIY
jgi:outer membrane lipoprotein-sorting protein